MPRDLEVAPPPPPAKLTNPVLTVLHALHSLIESKDPSQVNLNRMYGPSKCIYGWALHDGTLQDIHPGVQEYLCNTGLFAGTLRAKAMGKSHYEVALQRLKDMIREEEKIEIHRRSWQALTNAI